MLWLNEHLALLAAEPAVQEQYLRAYGTWDMLDELKLGWDDYYDVVRPQGRLPAELVSALDAVSAALAAVREEHWLGPEALTTADWSFGRSTATAAAPSAAAYLRRLDPAAIVRCPGESLGDGTFLGTNVHIVDSD